jgi:isocitrate/isopropylmalate dehydrogenase
MAMFLTAKMMLEWLGEKPMADRLEAAIAAVLKEGKARTYDMGGTTGTKEMGEAVIAKL